MKYFSLTLILTLSLTLFEFDASAQCLHTSQTGSVIAPTTEGERIAIGDCTTSGKYGSVLEVSQSTLYESSASFTGAYITVRQGTYDGPVVAHGLAPLTWASTEAGTYYTHLSGNADCVEDIVCHTLYISYKGPAPNDCFSQMNGGNGFAPTSENPYTLLSSCTQAGEFNEILEAEAAIVYESNTDLVGGYFTIRQGNASGPLIARGTAPIQWTSKQAGTYYIILTTDQMCGSDTDCHVTDITYVGPSPDKCNNSVMGQNVLAPESGTLYFPDCTYTGEYTTLFDVEASTIYTSTTDRGGHITIRRGTNGSVVADGPAPLTWTSEVRGRYSVHLNYDAACTDDAGICYTSKLTHVGFASCSDATPNGIAQAPKNGSTVITSCMNAGQYNELNDVQANTIYESRSDFYGGRFTIRKGSHIGPIVAKGRNPLNWQSEEAGTYYIFLNTDVSCGADESCHNSEIEFVGPRTDCIGTMSVGLDKGKAPTNENPWEVLASCTYAGQYVEMTDVAAATTYEIETDIIGKGYVTIREGSPDGPVVSHGTPPLVWTSRKAGSHYIHINTDISCGSDYLCHYVFAQYVDLNFPDPSKWYVLKNKDSGLNMRINDCQTTAGTYLELTSGNGDCAQFRFIKVGDFWHIENKEAGLNIRNDDCNDINDATLIELVDGAGDCAQWEVLPAESRYFHLKNKASGLNIRNEDCGAVDNFTRMELINGTGDCAQWELIEMGTIEMGTIANRASAVNKDAEEGHSNFEIAIFPNPTTNQVTIQGIQGEYSVRLINLQGQEVLLAEKLHHTGTLDISALPVGIYQLTIQMGNKQIVRKLMVN